MRKHLIEFERPASRVRRILPSIENTPAKYAGTFNASRSRQSRLQKFYGSFLLFLLGIPAQPTESDFLCYNIFAMNLKEELKQLIIDTLELEDIVASDISDSEPLFGEGLGLDSIDALELGMAIKRKYNITLSNNKEENKKFFYSIDTLSEFVESKINE